MRHAFSASVSFRPLSATVSIHCLRPHPSGSVSVLIAASVTMTRPVARSNSELNVSATFFSLIV